MRRFAVYHTCAPGPLADFGAAWLGWNAAAGATVPHPDVAGLPAPVEAITATPRRYGFHATIKAPFRPVAATTADDVARALDSFGAAQAAVRLPRLVLSAGGRFVALVPAGDTADLARLEAAAVRAFDRFRAPPTGAETARRANDRLTGAQRGHLARWGYPYVLDQFRFHMTLSGDLGAEPARQVRDALAPHVAPLIDGPYVVGALSLMGEDGDGMFHQLHRVALTG